MLQHIDKRINLKTLKKDFRRVGINLVTAGIVGIFINHFVGTTLSTMFLASFSVTCSGLSILCVGNTKKRPKK